MILLISLKVYKWSKKQPRIIMFGGDSKRQLKPSIQSPKVIVTTPPSHVRKKNHSRT